jgi:putative oxidoreductase
MQPIASLIGRLMLAAIFLVSAIQHEIPQFGSVASTMAAKGVPQPVVSLAIAITVMFIGSFLVILGFRARVGAAMLMALLAFTSYFLHDFWNFQGDERQVQLVQFMKNFALMGAMLFIIANGPGAMSLSGLRPDTRRIV